MRGRTLGALLIGTYFVLCAGNVINKHVVLNGMENDDLKLTCNVKDQRNVVADYFTWGVPLYANVSKITFENRSKVIRINQGDKSHNGLYVCNATWDFPDGPRSISYVQYTALHRPRSHPMDLFKPATVNIPVKHCKDEDLISDIKDAFNRCEMGKCILQLINTKCNDKKKKLAFSFNAVIPADYKFRQCTGVNCMLLKLLKTVKQFLMKLKYSLQKVLLQHKSVKSKNTLASILDEQLFRIAYNQHNLFDKSECEPGFYNELNNLVCTACPPGTYGSIDKGACIKCDKGMYQAKFAENSCYSCHGKVMKNGGFCQIKGQHTDLSTILKWFENGKTGLNVMDWEMPQLLESLDVLDEKNSSGSSSMYEVSHNKGSNLKINKNAHKMAGENSKAKKRAIRNDFEYFNNYEPSYNFLVKHLDTNAGRSSDIAVASTNFMFPEGYQDKQFNKRSFSDQDNNLFDHPDFRYGETFPKINEMLKAKDIISEDKNLNYPSESRLLFQTRDIHPDILELREEENEISDEIPIPNNEKNEHNYLEDTSQQKRSFQDFETLKNQEERNTDSKYLSLLLQESLKENLNSNNNKNAQNFASLLTKTLGNNYAQDLYKNLKTPRSVEPNNYNTDSKQSIENKIASLLFHVRDHLKSIRSSPKASNKNTPDRKRKKEVSSASRPVSISQLHKEQVDLKNQIQKEQEEILTKLVKLESEISLNNKNKKFDEISSEKGVKELDNRKQSEKLLIKKLQNLEREVGQSGNKKISSGNFDYKNNLKEIIGNMKNSKDPSLSDKAAASIRKEIQSEQQAILKRLEKIENDVINIEKTKGSKHPKDSTNVQKREQKRNKNIDVNSKKLSVTSQSTSSAVKDSGSDARSNSPNDGMETSQAIIAKPSPQRSFTSAKNKVKNDAKGEPVESSELVAKALESFQEEDEQTSEKVNAPETQEDVPLEEEEENEEEEEDTSSNSDPLLSLEEEVQKVDLEVHKNQKTLVDSVRSNVKPVKSVVEDENKAVDDEILVEQLKLINKLDKLEFDKKGKAKVISALDKVVDDFSHSKEDTADPVLDLAKEKEKQIDTEILVVEEQLLENMNKIETEIEKEQETLNSRVASVVNNEKQVELEQAKHTVLSKLSTAEEEIRRLQYTIGALREKEVEVSYPESLMVKKLRDKLSRKALSKLDRDAKALIEEYNELNAAEERLGASKSDVEKNMDKEEEEAKKDFQEEQNEETAKATAHKIAADLGVMSSGHHEIIHHDSIETPDGTQKIHHVIEDPHLGRTHEELEAPVHHILGKPQEMKQQMLKPGALNSKVEYERRKIRLLNEGIHSITEISLDLLGFICLVLAFVGFIWLVKSCINCIGRKYMNSRLRKQKGMLKEPQERRIERKKNEVKANPKRARAAQMRRQLLSNIDNKIDKTLADKSSRRYYKPKRKRRRSSSKSSSRSNWSKLRDKYRPRQRRRSWPRSISSSESNFNRNFNNINNANTNNVNALLKSTATVHNPSDYTPHFRYPYKKYPMVLCPEMNYPYYIPKHTSYSLMSNSTPSTYTEVSSELTTHKQEPVLRPSCIWNKLWNFLTGPWKKNNSTHNEETDSSNYTSTYSVENTSSLSSFHRKSKTKSRSRRKSSSKSHHRSRSKSNHRSRSKRRNKNYNNNMSLPIESQNELIANSLNDSYNDNIV